MVFCYHVSNVAAPQLDYRDLDMVVLKCWCTVTVKYG